MAKLTEQDDELLFDILDSFDNKAEKKFKRGKAEHGGFLGDMTPLQLLDNAIDETIDQYTYLYTLRLKLSKKK